MPWHKSSRNVGLGVSATLDPLHEEARRTSVLFHAHGREPGCYIMSVYCSPPRFNSSGEKSLLGTSKRNPHFRS